MYPIQFGQAAQTQFSGLRKSKPIVLQPNEARHLLGQLEPLLDTLQPAQVSVEPGQKVTFQYTSVGRKGGRQYDMTTKQPQVVISLNHPDYSKLHISTDHLNVVIEFVTTSGPNLRYQTQNSGAIETLIDQTQRLSSLYQQSLASESSDPKLQAALHQNPHTNAETLKGLQLELKVVSIAEKALQANR